MIIRVKLNDQKRIYRDIAIDPMVNLVALASAVLKSFEFNNDHCYGFFTSPDVYGKGKDVVHYELFYDIGGEVEELTRSVEKTSVNELFKNVKDKRWMLFDYGDDWIFELECRNLDDMPGPNGNVVRSAGEAPQQYGY